MTRYTIELSVKKVDEDGDTFGEEIFGASLDYTTTNELHFDRLFDKMLEAGNDLLEKNVGEEIQLRRPDDDELPPDMYDVFKTLVEEGVIAPDDHETFANYDRYDLLKLYRDTPSDRK